MDLRLGGPVSGAEGETGIRAVSLPVRSSWLVLVVRKRWWRSYPPSEAVFQSFRFAVSISDNYMCGLQGGTGERESGAVCSAMRRGSCCSAFGLGVKVVISITQVLSSTRENTNTVERGTRSVACVLAIVFVPVVAPLG